MYFGNAPPMLGIDGVVVAPPRVPDPADPRAPSSFRKFSSEPYSSSKPFNLSPIPGSLIFGSVIPSTGVLPGMVNGGAIRSRSSGRFPSTTISSSAPSGVSTLGVVVFGISNGGVTKSSSVGRPPLTTISSSGVSAKAGLS